MDLNLKNKVALVTGSSHGIGLGIAKQLSHIGCRVVLNGRNLSRLEKARKQLSGEVILCPADLSVVSDCERLLQETLQAFNQIDILICNVGYSQSLPPGEETPQAWELMLQANLMTATNMIGVCQDALAKTQGNIICISSICGMETIPNAPLTYSVAKAALNAFVKGASRPFAKKGIRVNAIAPGNILFEGSVWDKKLKETPDKVQQMLEEKVPLQRLGCVEDISNIVTFLASEKASFITGGLFVVDGGQTCHF